MSVEVKKRNLKDNEDSYSKKSAFDDGDFRASFFKDEENNEEDEKNLDYTCKRIENPDKAIEFLKEEGVLIENDEKLKNFLYKNLEIIEYLYEFLGVSSRYFENYDLSIEIEDSPYEKQLFLIVLVNSNDIQNVFSKLEEVESNWLVSVMDKGVYNLNLSLDFQE